MQNNLFFLSIQDQIKLIYINLTSLKIVMKKNNVWAEFEHDQYWIRIMMKGQISTKIVQYGE